MTKKKYIHATRILSRLQLKILCKKLEVPYNGEDEIQIGDYLYKVSKEIEL